MSTEIQDENIKSEDKEFDLFFLIEQLNFDKLTELFAIHYFPDVNVSKEHHQNGIFIAARHIKDDSQCLKMIQFLIKNGLDPLLIDSNSQTVLYYTSAAGFLQTTKYLYENYSFDKYQVDILKQTPMFYAVKYDRVDIVNFLYSKGYDVNHINSYGENCLYALRGNDSIDMARCLLSKGVDINNKGRDGISFLQFANKIGWFNIMNVIEGISGEEEEEKKNYMLVYKETMKPMSEEEMKKFFENDIEMYNRLLGREKNYYGNINSNNEKNGDEEVMHNGYGNVDKKDDEGSDSDVIDINA